LQVPGVVRVCAVLLGRQQLGGNGRRINCSLLYAYWSVQTHVPSHSCYRRIKIFKLQRDFHHVIDISFKDSIFESYWEFRGSDRRLSPWHQGQSGRGQKQRFPSWLGWNVPYANGFYHSIWPSKVSFREQIDEGHHGNSRSTPHMHNWFKWWKEVHVCGSSQPFCRLGRSEWLRTESQKG